MAMLLLLLLLLLLVQNVNLPTLSKVSIGYMSGKTLRLCTKRLLVLKGFLENWQGLDSDHLCLAPAG